MGWLINGFLSIFKRPEPKDPQATYLSILLDAIEALENNSLILPNHIAQALPQQVKDEIFSQVYVDMDSVIVFVKPDAYTRLRDMFDLAKAEQAAQWQMESS